MFFVLILGVMRFTKRMLTLDVVLQHCHVSFGSIIINLILCNMGKVGWYHDRIHEVFLILKYVKR